MANLATTSNQMISQSYLTLRIVIVRWPKIWWYEMVRKKCHWPLFPSSKEWIHQDTGTLLSINLVFVMKLQSYQKYLRKIPQKFSKTATIANSVAKRWHLVTLKLYFLFRARRTLEGNVIECVTFSQISKITFKIDSKEDVKIFV